MEDIVNEALEREEAEESSGESDDFSDDLYGEDEAEGFSNEPYEHEQVIAVSDIHGYLGGPDVDYEGAEELLEGVEDHLSEEYGGEGLVSRNDNPNDKYDWNLEAEDTTLVFLGDMIDRGDQSAEALDMVFDLMDQAEEKGNPDQVQYLLGNHEMALAMPDAAGVGGGMDEEPFFKIADDEEKVGKDYRHEFLERMATGQIKAAFRPFENGPVYLHAGTNEEVDVEELNDKLQNAGEELLHGYRVGQGQFEEIQSRVANKSEYEKLFASDSSGLHKGRGPESGIFWLDFEYIDQDTAPSQVVGHTRGHAGIRIGNVLNINSIRDYQSAIEGGKMVVSLQTEEQIYSLTYTPLSDNIVTVPEDMSVAEEDVEVGMDDLAEGEDDELENDEPAWTEVEVQDEDDEIVTVDDAIGDDEPDEDMVSDDVTDAAEEVQDTMDRIDDVSGDDTNIDETGLGDSDDEVVEEESRSLRDRFRDIFSGEGEEQHPPGATVEDQDEEPEYERDFYSGEKATKFGETVEDIVGGEEARET